MMGGPSLSRRVVIEPGSIAVHRMPRGERHPGWSRLQVLACGICGTDQHLLHGMVLPPGVSYPVYPGHEVAARVIEADAQVGPEPGSIVVLHPLLPCGSCASCTTGSEQLCPTAGMLGIHHKGGLADEMLWRSDRLVQIRNVDPVVAALLPDAVTTAYRAVQRAVVPKGGKLAVIGAGGVGTSILKIAQALDPTSQLAAVVRSDGTATRVRSLGVPVVQGLEGAGRAMRKLIGEVDAVIDFSGVVAASGEGVRMLRRGGRLVLGAVLDEQFALTATYTSLVTREIEIVGTYTSTVADLRTVVGMVESGRLSLEGMVSNVVNIDDVARAFAILEERPAGTVRVVVQP
jgi:2-desacetyl-2-hydroxyethyl bacteriochlorophyllide A dehydrogenase